LQTLSSNPELALEELGKVQEAIGVYQKIAGTEGCANQQWAEAQLARLGALS